MNKRQFIALEQAVIFYLVNIQSCVMTCALPAGTRRGEEGSWGRADGLEIGIFHCDSISLPADKTKELLMPQFPSVRLVLYLISSLI